MSWFKKVTYRAEDTAAFFVLSVTNPGYIVNKKVVDQMLDDYGLLDKQVQRFIATERGIDAFCLTGKVDDDGKPVLKRRYRMWREHKERT